MKRIAIDIPKKKKLVVVGNGLSAFKFCQKFVKYRLHKRYELEVWGSENYYAYDRINLSNFFCSASMESLRFATPSWYAGNFIAVKIGEPIVEISRENSTISTQKGVVSTYDKLVLAMGSRPYIPSIQGTSLSGVFAYRTIGDLLNIRSYLPRVTKVVVIGGGILGIEAARALLGNGLQVCIVELNSRLMPRQLDEKASDLLKTFIQSLGISVLLGKRLETIVGEEYVTRVQFSDGSVEEADMLIFSAGIVANSELAVKAGLRIGATRGILVNDYTLTSDPNIFAIGECAEIKGRIWGLAAPSYEMADVLAARLSGIFKVFAGDVEWTRLKVAETQVASFGSSETIMETRALLFENIQAGIYRKILTSLDNKKLVGGILIGNTSGISTFLQILRNKGRLPDDMQLDKLVAPTSENLIRSLPSEAKICMCEDINKAQIEKAIQSHSISTLDVLKKITRAGTGCESCVNVLEDILQNYKEVSV